MTDRLFLCSLLQYRTYRIEPPYITWISYQKVAKVLFKYFNLRFAFVRQSICLVGWLSS